MNQLEVCRNITVLTGISERIVNKLLAGLFDVITENLIKGNEITFPGFGKFSVKTKKGRGKDVNEELTVIFTVGATLAKYLKEKETVADKILKEMDETVGDQITNEILNDSTKSN